MWVNLVDNEKMGEKNLVEVVLKGQALMMKKAAYVLCVGIKIEFRPTVDRNSIPLL